MGKLADTYAAALVQYAQEKDRLGPMYRQVCSHLNKPLMDTGEPMNDELVNADLVDFLAYLEKKGRQGNADEILERFLELARVHLGVLGVEVITAVPLTQQQLVDLHIRLVKRSRKQIQLLPEVDPTLIAGMRIVVDGMVLDTSVKEQLNRMKENIYKEVYFSR